MSVSSKYPIYVISKGRSGACLTANFLSRDNIDFKLVVEPQEYKAYAERYGDKVVQLPFSNLGLGSYPARNWCWDDSMANGDKRHWVVDDNCRGVVRFFKGVRISTNSIYGFRFIEDLTDNYKNVVISGMNYEMFITPKTNRPIVTNCHVYSNLLIRNDIPQRWRLRYNEDTDLNLQVLKAGYCTLYTNIFGIRKMQTMTMKGGNTNELYKGDGRLKMARMLEKVHPDVVEVKTRFGRPQHVVKWGVFKQPLIPIDKPKDIKLSDYGKLTEVGQVKSPAVKKLLEKANG